MLSINNLDIRFGDKVLFNNVSVQVYRGNRIGLVGVNGAGKSTLLKIMAGVESCDDGVVSCSRHFTIGYLAQESPELFSDRSLVEEAKTAFAPLLAMQQELDELTAALAVGDGDDSDRLVQRHGELMQYLEQSDLYALDGKIERVLLGLGFSADDLTRPAASFSGGWQMRLKLAKILLEEPSLLLLDEPTNHLDLESLTWVERFLAGYRGSIVVISHDRTFLDKMTEQTWELSFGRIDIYKGNYSHYLKEREERRAIERGAYQNQQAKIRQTMRFVDRFRSKATKARQVQSRIRQLEKMELVELSEEESSIHFRFPPAPASGRDVLRVKGLSKGFDGSQVFSDADLLFSRGDKVAVVGVNGAGKTTFLKILAGEIEADAGSVSFGSGVRMTYFGQHQARELNPQLSVLETMELAGEGLSTTARRSLLGAFLFRGEAVEKKVAVLSGGEKSRLALAKMIAVPANCMLLDEPTNHLDMSSQEVLQEAMRQYDGTVVVVSHNRSFVDAFVSKVLEVKAGRLTMYEGNVAEYLQKLDEMRKEEEKRAVEAAERPVSTQKKSAAAQKKGPRTDRREEKRRQAKLRQQRSLRAGKWLKQRDEAEATIEQLEEQKEALEGVMADPALYNDQQKWSGVSADYEECGRRLERSYNRWEEAQQKIDAIDAELGLTGSSSNFC